MAIFDEVSKHAAYISLKLGKLKKDSVEYQSLKSTKEAILGLGKELAISTGTNSDIVTEKQYKSRPIASCSATHSVNVSLTRGVLNYIAFDTNQWDDLGWKNDKSANFHSPTVENTKFFIRKEGKYYIAAYARLAALAVARYPAISSISLIKTDNAGVNTVIVQNSVFESAVDGVAYDVLLNCFANPYLFPGEYIRMAIFHENTSPQVNRNIKAVETAGGLTYLSPNLYISGPTGETNQQDGTKHFRPSSNAVPRVDASGGGGGNVNYVGNWRLTSTTAGLGSYIWDTEDVNTSAGLLVRQAGNTQIKCNFTGLLHIHANLMLSGLTTDGNTQLELSGTIKALGYAHAGAASSFGVAAIHFILQVASGEYIEFKNNHGNRYGAAAKYTYLTLAAYPYSS